MPDYTYSAHDEHGNVKTGTLNAVDLSSAASTLSDMGLSPDEILESNVPVRHSYQSDDDSEDVSPFEKRYDESIHIDRPGKQADPVDWPDMSERQVHTIAEDNRNLPPQSPHVQDEPERQYYPISETLRLYAGWLLAWYFLVYAIGAYQISRDLPFRVPYVEAWLPPYSPLILTFALASFVFLLSSTIHKTTGEGKLKGTFITIVAAAAFVLYRINV